MSRVVLWSSSAGDIPANLAFTNNYAAIVAPAVTDDSSKGYSVGSDWVNTITKIAYVCVSAAVGAALWVVTSSNESTPGQVTAPAASTATGAGGAAKLTGGTGGTTSGDGGPASVVGGAATAGNGNGASAVTQGGAKNGTGIKGGSRLLDAIIVTQGAPTAKTVSATLTGPEVAAGIITVAQGAGAPSALQLPTGTALQAALPADLAIGEAFDFSVINTSTVDAEDASITVNTDVTIVGSPDIPAHSGITLLSSGRFRARKTADHAFVVYRLA